MNSLSRRCTRTSQNLLCPNTALYLVICYCFPCFVFKSLPLLVYRIPGSDRGTGARKLISVLMKIKSRRCIYHLVHLNQTEWAAVTGGDTDKFQSLPKFIIDSPAKRNFKPNCCGRLDYTENFQEKYGPGKKKLCTAKNPPSLMFPQYWDASSNKRRSKQF